MSISVELVFANNQRQEIIQISVPPSCCIKAAIQLSGILSRFPNLDLTKNKVGIFGKLSTLDTKLKAGDRIEIYQPLIMDPKKSRRNRAKKQKMT